MKNEYQEIQERIEAMVGELQDLFKRYDVQAMVVYAQPLSLKMCDCQSQDHLHMHMNAGAFGAAVYGAGLDTYQQAVLAHAGLRQIRAVVDDGVVKTALNEALDDVAAEAAAFPDNVKIVEAAESDGDSVHAPTEFDN